MSDFNGLHMNLGTLLRLSRAETRSISAENPTGEKGKGGMAMGWSINNAGWWGEGEIKFYIDGDTTFPTICGTGTEDYFGGSYD